MHRMPEGLHEFRVADPIPDCSRWKQHMPATRDRATYDFYMQARKLWRSKIEWELTHSEARKILSDVDMASKRGDWGARALMAYFYRTGLGPLSSNKVLDKNAEKAVEIARQAAAAGQPWGFYDLGVAHEHGYGGAIYDQDIAWAYYLKAARVGSPDAQMALAEAYQNAGRSDAHDAMWQCAFQQGHGPAAYKLALRAEVRGKYWESLNLYHEGVRFGSRICADNLYLMFNPDVRMAERKEIFEVTGITTDQERGRRYLAISEALQINPDLRLDRLNEFLPLPPAKLPDWRGVSDVVTPEPDGPSTY
ncbi:SEL1-like repeat protein [Pseudoduganella namucuonensis]|uniref:TPR repeat n=1 Tax=Pseudoduganella namucuonensis TaxID=1035707 RepID=A0A1I7L6U5_9BURK|nr:DUF6396 domain-containing protein [Pseudoduganella namucuonensis]SFV05204.1 TPR repeat [Pseudoduganella namucuonensis]